MLGPHMSEQLDMFGATAPRRGGLGLAQLPEQLHALGRALPQHLRMGTSSWSFTGWTDLVWERRNGSTARRRDHLWYHAH
jgi:hypothetical protein